MFVTVWYGDEFQSIGSDEFVSLDTTFQDLRNVFPNAVMVTLSGDDM